MVDETVLEEQLKELGFRFIKPVTCLNCKKEFMPRHSNHKFCSEKCREQARRIYKGYELEWANLREFVLERDNYTCQDCHR
jgi:5-methylcytosine-specific restriction endonuclease McrA